MTVMTTDADVGPMMRSTNVIIRPRFNADVPELRAIYNDYVALPDITAETEELAERDVARMIRDHDFSPYPLLVAEDSHGRILGFAMLSCVDARKGFDGTAETTIYCNKSFRGQGVGTLLMESLLEYARCNEFFHELRASIVRTNLPSIGLHQKFGFRLDRGRPLRMYKQGVESLVETWIRDLRAFDANTWSAR